MHRPSAGLENGEVVLQDVNNGSQLVNGGHAPLGTAHQKRGDSSREHSLPMLPPRADVGVNPHAALLAEPLDDLGVLRALPKDFYDALGVEPDCGEGAGDGRDERLVYEEKSCVRQRSSPAKRLRPRPDRARRGNFR